MINWINTKVQPVPKDGKIYLGLWKGCFCLLQWNEGFYMALAPADFEWSKTPLDQESENKIYYWAEINYPVDW